MFAENVARDITTFDPKPGEMDGPADYASYSDQLSWKTRVRWFKLFWLVIFSKRFRRMLKDTILYALNNHREKHGYGASDVVLFSYYYSDRILKKKRATHGFGLVGERTK